MENEQSRHGGLGFCLLYVALHASAGVIEVCPCRVLRGTRACRAKPSNCTMLESRQDMLIGLNIDSRCNVKEAPLYLAWR